MMIESTAAVVSRQHGEFELCDVTLDDIRSGEILVEIVAVGICHTDLAIRDRDFPIPEYPIVLGHEGAGRVVAVGAEVTKVRPGDHVVLSFASCGACAACLKGTPSECVSFVPLNMSGARPDGSFVHSCNGSPVHGSFFGQSSFARHAVVSQRNVIKVDKDLPLEILGPLGCAIQTGAGTVLNAIKPSNEASIVIFGTGAVGLAAVMGAKIAGCAKIIAVDLHEDRLALAREFGATHTINAGTDVAAEIREITGAGADHVVEASGAGPALEAAFSAIRFGGSIAIVGMPRAGTMITIPFTALMGASVRTVSEGDSDPETFIPELIGYYREGRLPFDRLIDFYDFAQINEAAKDGEAGRSIKPVLRMSATGTV